MWSVFRQCIELLLSVEKKMLAVILRKLWTFGLFVGLMLEYTYKISYLSLKVLNSRFRFKIVFWNVLSILNLSIRSSIRYLNFILSRIQGLDLKIIGMCAKMFRKLGGGLNVRILDPILACVSALFYVMVCIVFLEYFVVTLDYFILNYGGKLGDLYSFELKDSIRASYLAVDDVKGDSDLGSYYYHKIKLIKWSVDYFSKVSYLIIHNGVPLLICLYFCLIYSLVFGSGFYIWATCTCLVSGLMVTLYAHSDYDVVSIIICSFCFMLGCCGLNKEILSFWFVQGLYDGEYTLCEEVFSSYEVEDEEDDRAFVDFNIGHEYGKYLDVDGWQSAEQGDRAEEGLEHGFGDHNYFLRRLSINVVSLGKKFGLVREKESDADLYPDPDAEFVVAEEYPLLVDLDFNMLEDVPRNISAKNYALRQCTLSNMKGFRVDFNLNYHSMGNFETYYNRLMGVSNVWNTSSKYDVFLWDTWSGPGQNDSMLDWILSKNYKLSSLFKPGYFNNNIISRLLTNGSSIWDTSDYLKQVRYKLLWRQLNSDSIRNYEGRFLINKIYHDDLELYKRYLKEILSFYNGASGTSALRWKNYISGVSNFDYNRIGESLGKEIIYGGGEKQTYYNDLRGMLGASAAVESRLLRDLKGYYGLDWRKSRYSWISMGMLESFDSSLFSGIANGHQNKFLVNNISAIAGAYFQGDMSYDYLYLMENHKVSGYFYNYSIWSLLDNFFKTGISTFMLETAYAHRELEMKTIPYKIYGLNEDVLSLFKELEVNMYTGLVVKILNSAIVRLSGLWHIHQVVNFKNRLDSLYYDLFEGLDDWDMDEILETEDLEELQNSYYMDDGCEVRILPSEQNDKYQEFQRMLNYLKLYYYIPYENYEDEFGEEDYLNWWRRKSKRYQRRKVDFGLHWLSVVWAWGGDHSGPSQFTAASCREDAFYSIVTEKRHWLSNFIVSYFMPESGKIQYSSSSRSMRNTLYAGRFNFNVPRKILFYERRRYKRFAIRKKAVARKVTRYFGFVLDVNGGDELSSYLGDRFYDTFGAFKHLYLDDFNSLGHVLHNRKSVGLWGCVGLNKDLEEHDLYNEHILKRPLYLSRLEHELDINENIGDHGGGIPFFIDLVQDEVFLLDRLIQEDKFGYATYMVPDYIKKMTPVDVLWNARRGDIRLVQDNDDVFAMSGACRDGFMVDWSMLDDYMENSIDYYFYPHSGKYFVRGESEMVKSKLLTLEWRNMFLKDRMENYVRKLYHGLLSSDYGIRAVDMAGRDLGAEFVTQAIPNLDSGQLFDDARASIVEEEDEEEDEDEDEDEEDEWGYWDMMVHIYGAVTRAVNRSSGYDINDDHFQQRLYRIDPYAVGGVPYSSRWRRFVNFEPYMYNIWGKRIRRRRVIGNELEDHIRAAIKFRKPEIFTYNKAHMYGGVYFGEFSLQWVIANIGTMEDNLKHWLRENMFDLENVFRFGKLSQRGFFDLGNYFILGGITKDLVLGSWFGRLNLRFFDTLQPSMLSAPDSYFHRKMFFSSSQMVSSSSFVSRSFQEILRDILCVQRLSEFVDVVERSALDLEMLKRSLVPVCDVNLEASDKLYSWLHYGKMNVESTGATPEIFGKIHSSASRRLKVTDLSEQLYAKHIFFYLKNKNTEQGGSQLVSSRILQCNQGSSNTTVYNLSLKIGLFFSSRALQFQDSSSLKSLRKSDYIYYNRSTFCLSQGLYHADYLKYYR